MLSKKIILFFLLLPLSQNVLAQNYIWEKLNAPVGLAVTGISQTSSGDFYISSAGSGIYFYQITTKNHREAKKMVLLK